VRELRNVLEQAVLLGAGVVIEAHHLALPTPRFTAGLGLPGAPGASPTIGLAAPTTLNDLERNALVQALDQTGWNVSRAARILGISRDTLRYRIEKHRLVEPPR
jgi:DNA-binding NtrC family response regulator